MRRAAIILLAALAATAALWLAFLGSPASKRFAGDIAARELADALGGEVEIGAVTGSVFSQFQLRNLRFRNQSILWAEIEHVDIRWTPIALLRKKIAIASITIENARINTLPPTRGERKPFKGFELPEQLPGVSIGKIDVVNLQVGDAIVGDAIRLDGAGRVDLGGRNFSIDLAVNGQDGRDAATVRLDRNAEDGRLVVEAKVFSEATGAIAALSRAGGPVNLSAQGEGSPQDYRLRIGGAFGDAGSIDAQLGGDLETLEAVTFSLTAVPGRRFEKWAEDVGAMLVAEGEFIPAVRGGHMDLNRLTLGAGAASGTIDWRNGADSLQTAAVNLNLDFADFWRPDLQRAIGNKVAAAVNLDRRQKSFDLDAKVTCDFLALDVVDGFTDLGSRLGGRIKVKVAPESSLAALAQSAIAGNADFTFLSGDSIGIENAEIKTPDGLRLSGEAHYAFDAQTFSAKGGLSFTDQFLVARMPALRARGNTTADFDITGGVENFALRLTATAPALAVDSAIFAPARATLSLTGLPANPVGSLSYDAFDGSRTLTSKVGVTNGYWRLKDLLYRGKGFVLSGGLGVKPETREGALDLSYQGGAGAEPWPGILVEGDARASGALNRARGDNQISAQIDSIRVASVFILNLGLEANGPFDELSFGVSASAVDVADRGRFGNIAVKGELDLDNGPKAALASARAEFDGAPISTLQPASVSFGEGIAIQNAELKIGERGVAKIAGAFTRSRWQAVADIRDLEVSGGAATAALSLDLDTNRAEPASGRFALSSTIAPTETITLPGRFTWDGRQLHIVTDKSAGAFDADLALPLVLRRGDRLGVDFSGRLRGTAGYVGRAEGLSLFLPPALQSLEGALEFSGALGGDTASPKVEGSLRLSDGAFTELNSGLSVVDIDLDAAAEATTAGSVLKFSASASGAGQTRKSIEASGAVTLRDSLKINTVVNLDRAQFSAGPVERVDASGLLTIEGTPEDMLVHGDIDVAALKAELFTPQDLGLVDIDVIAVNGDGKSADAGPAAGKSSRKSGLRYQIRVTADDNIAVGGRGLDSTWRANTEITGDGERPVILGALNLRRGDLEFSGRRFKLTRGSILFDTLAPNDPAIDLRAENETREGVTVAIVIEGRSSALKVSLESTPARANEDIMALILFDKPAAELSAFESLQVADALTQLGGVGVFGGKGVAGAARDALGLDLINLEIDNADSSASLLTVGKYVTDGLFVSASQNARGENGSLRIEYEIGQSLSVETELRQDGDQTISANWKKDF